MACSNPKRPSLTSKKCAAPLELILSALLPASTHSDIVEVINPGMV